MSAQKDAVKQVGFILRELGWITVQLGLHMRGELWYSELREKIRVVHGRLHMLANQVGSMMKEE